MAKQFKRSEIEKNTEKTKNLFIIYDKVYDVHSFLNEHPGGEEVLIEHKGLDATEDFEDVGHSKDAIELMKKFQVGTLVESERSNKQQKKGWISGYTKGLDGSSKGMPPLYLLIGGIAIIAALYLYMY